MDAAIQEKVAAWLGADAEVRAQFGDRFYPNVLPQNTTLPAAVYQVISDVPVNSLDGYSGLSNARLQVDVYHGTYAKGDVAARILLNALRSVISGVDGAEFSSLLLARRDQYETETRLHRVNLDFSIWRNET